MSAQAPDVKLQPDDVVFIPRSTAKAASRRGLEAALQGPDRYSNLPPLLIGEVFALPRVNLFPRNVVIKPDKGQERCIQLCAPGANPATRRSNKSAEKADHRLL